MDLKSDLVALKSDLIALKSDLIVCKSDLNVFKIKRPSKVHSICSLFVHSFKADIYTVTRYAFLHILSIGLL